MAVHNYKMATVCCRHPQKTYKKTVTLELVYGTRLLSKSIKDFKTCLMQFRDLGANWYNWGWFRWYNFCFVAGLLHVTSIHAMSSLVTDKILLCKLDPRHPYDRCSHGNNLKFVWKSHSNLSQGHWMVDGRKSCC